MRILKNLLPLLVLLLWSATAKAQYNPTDPPEPGVYFTLTTQSVPSDGGNSFSGAGTYAFGSNVSMRVRPTTGYRFICWEDEEGTVVSTSQDFTYTMPAKNVRLTARFEYNPTSPSEPSTPEFTDESYITFRIVPSDAGYMYSGSNGKYEVGTTHNFTVRGNGNYRFVNWTSNGVEIGTSTTLNYTVTSGDQILVANFEYDPTNPAEPSVPNIPRRLNLLTNLNGAASLSGGGSHEVGSSFTISARSNTYYHFVNWTDDEGNTVSESSSFTYTMPNRDVTLTANYTYNYDPSSPGEPGTPNPDSGMAENMVLWPRMGMYDETHVQILCETPGATIHYTLDGTTPNTDSPVYTEPVFVGSNLLVRAIAYKEGMEDSPVVNYRVTVYKAATPVYTFENRKIKITSETPDAIIRYTLDFTNPNEESEVYTAPFEPEENCRIKAYASKEGLTDSPINTFVFRRADYTIPAPTFSIDEEGRLVITPAVIGGQTYYTLDGTDPTTSSTLYTEPLLIDGNFRIRACTVHPNYYDSLIGEYSNGGFKVETPTYDYANLALKLASATPGATLRYTLDGTIPTEAATVYSAPLRLMEDCKVVARGFKENYEPSDTISYTFKLADHKAATPLLTYDPETLTVIMTSATEDAEIRYTIDGEAPTATTGTVYAGPVAVVGNHVYTVRAFRSDLFASDSASVTVDDQKVQTPTSSYAAKLLTLSCPDTEATIHYTTDGTTPTAASATYAEPLTMSTDCTVKFIATREFFIDSDEAEYVFKVSDRQVTTPVLTYNPEALTVTMTCPTEGAEIRYTVDGETPTATTGTVYTGPVAVTGNHTYTAAAFRSDLFASDTASVTVEDQKVPTPTTTFANRLLTLTCPDAAAQIYYTTDGNAPTSASTLYTEPIALTSDCTVRFIGMRESFNDSEEGSFIFVYADHQVAVPAISYDPEAITVTMSCSTEGAEIRYTTDGSVPTATTGTAYTAPVAVVGNQTFTARAFLSNLFDSEVTTLTVDDQQVPTPTASFANRQLTLSCSDAAAEIHYTVDGSAPTSVSTLYAGPIALTNDCTVSFIGVRGGFNDSEVGTFDFVRADHQVAAPAISYDSDAKTVTMSCATDGAQIRYTTDGSVPTATTGTVYTAPIAVVGNQTFTTIAVLDGLFDSAVVTYTVDDQNVPTPTATFANRQLTLTCTDAAAQIRYTTDGSAPTSASTLYSGPVSLTENCTVRFIGMREGFNDSEVGTFEFVRADHQVANPAISYDSEAKTVTMSCATEGAEIRYTTDGSVPTATTGTAYTQPIPVVGNQTFTARAFLSSLFDSEVATLTINDQQVPTPTATFANRQLTLTCPDGQAIIRYTLDSSEPSTAWTLYEGPISLTENCTVRFYAMRDGFNDSEADSFEFVYSRYQVATPEFSYDSNTKLMTITCATEGAQIRYTTDGSVPTSTTGTVYTEPVPVVGNVTFNAIAVLDGLFDSAMAEKTVDDQAVDTPTASFSNKQLTLSCTSDGARIHYSMDEGQPKDQWTLYTAPLALTEDCTVYFYAHLDSFNDADGQPFEFVYSRYQVAKPVFSYDSDTEQMTITCTTDGAEIRYTADGSEQTAENGTVYTEPFAVEGNPTYKACAFKEGLFDSELAEDPSNPEKVPTPTATFANKVLTIACADPAARILYTTVAEAALAEWTPYTEPLALTENCTVRFYATRARWTDSDQGSYSFRYVEHQVATPVLSFDRESNLMTITCSTEGAEIRYTTDGSDPTATIGTLYTQPVPVASNMTFKAIATHSDLFNSRIAEETIDYLRVQTPTATFANKLLTLNCPDEGARIRYTMDEEQPREDWTLYTSPIALTADCKVFYYAHLDGLNDADGQPFEFVYADWQVTKPEPSYDSDTKLMTISCGTDGAEIRYTIDSEAPTADTGIRYEGRIAVVGNHLYIARAFRSDLFDSEPDTIAVTDQRVPKPTYDYAAKMLALACADGEATIHYTMDGTAPTAESATYSQPIQMTGDCKVRFIAVRGFFLDSEEEHFDFLVSDHQVAKPEFSYDSARKQMTISCDTVGAQIRYTIDGDAPTADTGIEYTGPFDVVGNHTFRAIATRADLFDSEVNEETVSGEKAATPEFQYDRERKLLSITCTTEGATIRYTDDGSNPTEESSLYEGAIEVIGNHDYVARAFHRDFEASDPVRFTVGDQTVDTPTASFSNKLLTLSCSDPEARIHYTTVAEAARAEWTPYTEPLALTENCTVHFYATREGLNDSEPGSYQFRYADHQVATPRFDFNRQSNRITITCDTVGAQIRYTNDGSGPTATSGTVYTGPIAVVGNHMFTARAFRSDLFDSAPATLNVNDQGVSEPTARFVNRHLVLECADEGAHIHYTTDRNAPTEASTLYEEPIALTQDCRVRYTAFLDGFNPTEGEPFDFVRDDWQVAKPKFSYDSARKQMTISCDTVGARIRYTIDGEAPTADTGIEYTVPFDVVGNHVYIARAFRSDLFDSEPDTIAVTDQRVPKPTYDYAAKMLTLACADGEATIHYTVDGTAPTAESATYSQTIQMTGDCKVRFIAVRGFFLDSEEEHFDFLVSDHQVAKPEFSYDSARKQMTISCDTVGARIRYTIDGEAPTADTGIEYTGPFEVVGNHIFKAIATRSDLFDSEVAERTVGGQQVPTPQPSYAKHKVALRCDDELAQIRYTVDNDTPVSEFGIYRDSIPVDGSCRIRFFATREGFLDSELDSIDFDRNEYTEAKPTFDPVYRDRKFAIRSNLPVKVTIDGGESFDYTAPIDVTPGMRTISAYTPASDDDMFDSEVETKSIVFHMAPKLHYDSKTTVSVAPGENEPQVEGIEFHAKVDEVEADCTYGVKVAGFGTVTVHAESDSAFRSESATEIIDFYNTGLEAGARNGHRIAEAFPDSIDRNNCKTLRMTGVMNREDFLFIASLPQLTDLDLIPDSIADDDYDDALSGSGIETIGSTEYPEGMLKDMPRLTTVIWNSDSVMPDGRLTEAGNPNILFWTTDKSLAPTDAVNVVTMGDGEGTAESIRLQAGKPFNAHLPIEVDNIELTKEFRLETVLGECAGWESIVLPFTPTSITHEVQGEIVPFNDWTDMDDPRKPFWLYSATQEGWEAESVIVANKPYIISMPNNEGYVDGYSLPGKVTFSTDYRTRIGEKMPDTANYKGAEFIGTFMPVDEQGILVLNVTTASNGEHLGSVFTNTERPQPFGAYLRGNLPSRIPVFGDWSGVLTPVAETTGLLVETPYPGMIRVTCSRNLHTAIVTPEGATVRTLSLKAGQSETVEGLTRGLYIVGGRKVMVR